MGMCFSSKLSRTPPMTGRGRAAFYGILVRCNANGRIGEREKGGSEKRRDDVHEEDLHDGHAWKDHSVADVGPVGGSELVRVGEDRRIATGARNDARHLVERHTEKEEA